MITLALIAALTLALAVGIYLGRRGAQALQRLWRSTAWLREPVGSDDEAAWW